MKLEDRCDPRTTIPASPLPDHIREDTARRILASQLERVAGPDWGWGIIAIAAAAMILMAYCASA